MVCAHCGSESHHTGQSACAKYCTLCKEPGHRQKRAGCKLRVCNKCGASGHSASECTPSECTRCTECGSTTHLNSLSVACPQHKCSNCEGTLEPKGHNRNNCPRIQTTMCDECGETGHSANKCPRLQECNECFSTSHKSALSFACPEHKCTNCEGSPQRVQESSSQDTSRYSFENYNTTLSPEKQYLSRLPSIHKARAPLRCNVPFNSRTRTIASRDSFHHACFLFSKNPAF